MSKTETILGLTPVLKRLAYSYLCRGLGTHEIKHPVYDTVEVAELYPWQQNPEDPAEYGAGLKVTFMRDGKRVRWAEFGVRFVGGGGSPAIFKVK